MRIKLDRTDDSLNRINSYSAGQIMIAQKTYQSSLLVSPDTIVPDWPPNSFSDLATSHMDQIITLAPEIVILGTGKSLTFPSELLLQAITERSIGIEIMDTGAACRSYNFLLGEGRHVVAALFMIEKQGHYA